MATKTRDQIDEKYQWDLTAIYPNKEAFLEDYQVVKEMIHDYKKYAGHTMDNASTFYQSIMDDITISRKLSKLYTYTSLKSDEDVSNNSNQELKQRVVNLYNYASEVMYFTTPELLQVDYSKIENFYKEEPRLLEHERNIKETYRYKDHILPEKDEKLLSSLSKAFGNDEETYSILSGSDMTFGTIKDENEEEIELTDTNYSIYIRSFDRRVRKEAFETLYRTYCQFKNTFTSMMNGKIKESVAIAHIRNYESAFAASLFEEEMDPKVYETLVETVHDNFPVLHDYYQLKKDVLQLEELHLYDVYTEMVEKNNKQYSFEDGKKLVIEALSVLGDSYIQDLQKAFTERWIDIFPNKNKRGGAYSGGCYDTNPYLLLNYQGKLDDVSALAHELGHSMHSYYTRNTQEYQYGDYPIFVAEVASTVNELLLAKYMLKHSNSKQEKLSVLNQLLELFKGTIYRQVMFQEFEKYAYDLVEKEEVITSEKLCQKYYELNQAYFGNSVVVDSDIQYEWERIPHFYNDFYVYKYATGLSAACKIVTGILNQEDGALENYLKMLKNGSKENPLNTLKIAGVDMTQREVYQTAITMFKETIQEFKEVLNSK